MSVEDGGSNHLDAMDVFPISFFHDSSRFQLCELSLIHSMTEVSITHCLVHFKLYMAPDQMGDNFCLKIRLIFSYSRSNFL